MPDKTYVMTDIHGRLAPLKALLAQIPDGAKIVFLGDYIDRGKQSIETINNVVPNKNCNPKLMVGAKKQERSS